MLQAGLHEAHLPLRADAAAADLPTHPAEAARVGAAIFAEADHPGIGVRPISLLTACSAAVGAGCQNALPCHRARSSRR